MRQLTPFGKKLFTFVAISIGVLVILFIIAGWDDIIRWDGWPLLLGCIFLSMLFIRNPWAEAEVDELKDKVRELEDKIDKVNKQ